MPKGWQCPNCGKAHGPHVDTCPEPRVLDPVVPPVWPPTTSPSIPTPYNPRCPTITKMPPWLEPWYLS